MAPPPAERPRDLSPQSATCRLHVANLTRNVTEAHVSEIFGLYGAIKAVELPIDRAVSLPKGFAYVEYESRADAEKARRYMDGGQIDGSTVKVRLRSGFAYYTCRLAAVACPDLHATGMRRAPLSP